MASANLVRAFQRQCEGASWLVLIDITDEDLLDAASCCPGDVLVILSDEAVLERLELGRRDSWPENFKLTSILLGPEVAEVPWFHYNDQRLNGRVPLEQLQSSFPNLVLERVELRLQISLAVCLERWEPSEGDGGFLVVGMDDPSPILISGAAFLQKLRGICALRQMRRFEGNEGLATISDLDAHLHACCLIRNNSFADDSSADELLWIFWERDEQLCAYAAIQAERDRINAARESLQAEKENLAASLNAVSGDRDCLQAALNESSAARESLQAEKENLAASLNAVSEDRDCLQAALNESSAARESLQAEKENLAASLNAVSGDRDCLQAALNESSAARESLQAEKENLAASLNAVSEDRDCLQAALNESRLSHQECSAELKSLLERCQVFEGKADDLKDQLSKVQADYTNALHALEMIFPLDLYEAKTPELAGSEMHVLLTHFLEYGHSEDRLLPYRDLAGKCESLHDEKVLLSQQVATLDEQFDKVSFQLDFLKDIIARILNRP